jgi:hypothetical protein
MSSQAVSREDGRRLSPRTLGIASIASATAAVVTSLFWKGGTPIAAAVTPVIVSVVSEMLHRPATKIASRFTSETDALPAEAAGGGAPPPRGSIPEEPPAREIATARRERTAVLEERLRTLPSTGGVPPRSNGAPEIKVYRAPSRRPRLAWKPIAATAAIAFLIAAAVLTLPELIAGQSFGQGDRGTTLFGGSGKSDSSSSDQQSPESQQDTESQPQQTSPDQPSESQTPETQEQTPTQPPAEEQAPPQSRQAPPPTTPAPAAPGEPAP